MIPNGVARLCWTSRTGHRWAFYDAERAAKAVLTRKYYRDVCDMAFGTKANRGRT